jgi:hypothetical protein
MSSAIRLRILQLAILLPSFSPMCSIVAAATVPDPPPQICLGSKCITTTGPKMKWHPGHYAQSDFYLTPSTLSQTYADIDRMAAVVDGSGKPRFKGYAVQFQRDDEGDDRFRPKPVIEQL